MTAIEWLYSKMYEHKGIIKIEEFEQAKEMEKQQIIDAWCDALDIKSSKYAEQYYQETFKNTEK